MTRLTLLIRPGCRICGMAREAMDRVQQRTGEPWTEVDATADPDLEEEYGLRLPVVLLDGKEHGYWQVEEDRLVRDLTAARQ